MDTISKTKNFPFFICPNSLVDDKLYIKDVRKNVERLMNNSEKIMLLYLLRCCNNGKSAFPSYNTIAEKCNMSNRNAIFCMNNLVESGYIIKKNRGFTKNNEGQVKKNFSNCYLINTEKL